MRWNERKRMNSVNKNGKGNKLTAGEEGGNVIECSEADLGTEADFGTTL